MVNRLQNTSTQMTASIIHYATILNVFLVSPNPTTLLLIAHIMKIHILLPISHTCVTYCAMYARKSIYGVHNLAAKEHTLIVITSQEFVVKQLSSVSSTAAKSW